MFGRRPVAVPGAEHCVRGLFLAVLGGLLVGCVAAPEGVVPVQNFEADRYLGRWYEIARLDHSFERGLNNVTANYSLREDGAIRVRNRGFNVEDGEWEDAEGVARFVGSERVGHLKVSFFGPFYGAYVVFELEREQYSYAFVSGPSRGNLWFLSREPVVSDALKAQFVQAARARGFPVEELIWVDQSGAPAVENSG